MNRLYQHLFQPLEDRWKALADFYRIIYDRRQSFATSARLQAWSSERGRFGRTWTTSQRSGPSVPPHSRCCFKMHLPRHKAYAASGCVAGVLQSTPCSKRCAVPLQLRSSLSATNRWVFATRDVSPATSHPHPLLCPYSTGNVLGRPGVTPLMN